MGIDRKGLLGRAFAKFSGLGEELAGTREERDALLREVERLWASLGASEVPRRDPKSTNWARLQARRLGLDRVQALVVSDLVNNAAAALTCAAAEVEQDAPEVAADLQCVASRLVELGRAALDSAPADPRLGAFDWGEVLRALAAVGVEPLEASHDEATAALQALADSAEVQGEVKGAA